MYPCILVQLSVSGVLITLYTLAFSNGYGRVQHISGTVPWYSAWYSAVVVQRAEFQRSTINGSKT